MIFAFFSLILLCRLIPSHSKDIFILYSMYQYKMYLSVYHKYELIVYTITWYLYVIVMLCIGFDYLQNTDNNTMNKKF